MLKARESAPRRGGVVKYALGVAAALLLWVTPAQAQLPCAPVEIAKAQMEASGAIPVATMLVEDKKIEIWASPDGARFVMFFVAEGMACPLVLGTDLHIVNVPRQES